jgi:hypothetical protein
MDEDDDDDDGFFSGKSSKKAPSLDKTDSKAFVGQLVDDDEAQVVEVSAAEGTSRTGNSMPGGAVDANGKVYPEGSAPPGSGVGLSINMAAMVVSAVRRMSTRITFAKKFHSNTVHPDLAATGIVPEADGEDGEDTNTADTAAKPAMTKLPSARGSLTRKSVTIMHKKADELQKQFAQAEKNKSQETEKTKTLAQQKLAERLNKRKGLATDASSPNGGAPAAGASEEETEEDRLNAIKQEKLLQHKLQESRMRKAMQEAQTRSAQMLQKRLDEIAAKRALTQVISDDEDSDNESKAISKSKSPPDATVASVSALPAQVAASVQVHAPGVAPAPAPAPADPKPVIQAAPTAPTTPARDIFYLSDDDD